MVSEYAFTDRYQAMGMEYPDPETMCHGLCEGTGFVPVQEGDMTEPWHSLMAGMSS